MPPILFRLFRNLPNKQTDHSELPIGGERTGQSIMIVGIADSTHLRQLAHPFGMTKIWQCCSSRIHVALQMAIASLFEPLAYFCYVVLRCKAPRSSMIWDYFFRQPISYVQASKQHECCNNRTRRKHSIEPLPLLFLRPLRIVLSSALRLCCPVSVGFDDTLFQQPSLPGRPA